MQKLSPICLSPSVQLSHPPNTPSLSVLAQVLLLDEITVDLDVLGRADLLAFLRDECEQRGATIIYVLSPLHACWLPACLHEDLLAYCWFA